MIGKENSMIDKKSSMIAKENSIIAEEHSMIGKENSVIAEENSMLGRKIGMKHCNLKWHAKRKHKSDKWSCYHKYYYDHFNLTKDIVIVYFAYLIQYSEPPLPLPIPLPLLLSSYRTITGECNNLMFKDWGSERSQMRRILPAYYDDGFGLPRGT